MVAVDEASMIQLQVDGSTSAQDFVKRSLFTNAVKHDEDLEDLEKSLIEHGSGLKINYRVFSATVPPRWRSSAR